MKAACEHSRSALVGNVQELHLVNRAVNPATGYSAQAIGVLRVALVHVIAVKHKKLLFHFRGCQNCSNATFGLVFIHSEK